MRGLGLKLGCNFFEEQSQKQKGETSKTPPNK